MQGRPALIERIAWWVLPVVLLVFVVWGTVVLVQQVGGLLNVAVVAPVALLLLLRVLPLLGRISSRLRVTFKRKLPRRVRTVSILVGAVVFPLYALVGFASLWWRAGWEQLEPIPSLLVGAAALGIAAWIYVHPWWVAERRRWPPVWAGAVVFLLVVVPFLVFGLWGAGREDGKELVTEREQAVSTLDVVVLRSGDQPRAYAAETVNGWRVRTWNGAVGAGGVTWGDGGPPAFVPSDNVDTVVLMMPPAGAEGDEATWLEHAGQATPPTTPAFALLETEDSAVLGRWTQAIRGADGRAGRARSLSDFRQNGLEPSVTDMALRLAALSPESDQLLALAARHRPALFFDSDEDDHSPLNIDRLIASGKMRLCERGEGTGLFCSTVDESSDLHNRATNLAFDPDELAKETTPTTIYVNARRSGNGGLGNAIYLDYWWYLARNPAGSGGGALCGPGFVIAGITCFDHQSDWEGVTVMLDADAKGGPPVAVTYAQHNHRTRYAWEALQAAWDRPIRRGPSARRRFGSGINTSKRPLAFVAQGTHASYPMPCRDVECQNAPSLLNVTVETPSSEKRHDGGRPWSGNTEENCQAICLEAFPTRGEGLRPGRWNAFSGLWGSPTCILGLPKICTNTNPPESPAFQKRFEQPWCADSAISYDANVAKLGNAPPCLPFRFSADELRAGERLLAMGDSFSSGHGAGAYEDGTTGGGNTCFRSTRAWPELVAERLKQRPLQSLACSGGRIKDVLEGKDQGEAERMESQVGRIARDPTLLPHTITLSIGGNDAEFARVLRDCIFLNCKARYDRPSGDELEEAALRVGRRLPELYEAIREEAPGARLVVMGYPRLFPEQKPPGAASRCNAWTGISGAEARYLNDAARFLNAQIAAAAEQEGATFVDVTEAFDGRELRCKGESYVQPFLSRTDPGWFHPNEAGHRKLADEVHEALRTPVSFFVSPPAP